MTEGNMSLRYGMGGGIDFGNIKFKLIQVTDYIRIFKSGVNIHRIQKEGKQNEKRKQGTRLFHSFSILFLKCTGLEK